VTEVVIGEHDRFDRSLKKFRKKVERSGVLADLRRKRYYEKPSAKRRRKADATERRKRRHTRRIRPRGRD
jgi:small subunit ribosomal protein S21